MKKISFTAMALLFAAMSFVVCKGQENLSNGDPDVYVAGFVHNARQDMDVATLWKNGVAQNLTDGSSDAQAMSVYVSGGDVYVAGWEKNAQGKQVATLWKNGVALRLTNGTYNAVAQNVYVVGSDVYVAGWEYNDDDNSVAKLWKNGAAKNLSDGSTNAQANSVYVSGGNVYVAGNDRNVAKLWKNGIAKNLSGGTMAASVYVSNGDVYVAGWKQDNAQNRNRCFPILWENGEAQSLFDGSSAQAMSVYVSGGDVYIAGAEVNIKGNPITAKLWKNGVVQNLTTSYDNSAVANSVYVLDDNAYIAGDVAAIIATVWKIDYDRYSDVASNTVVSYEKYIKSLSDGSADATAYSVFVANSNSNSQTENTAGNSNTQQVSGSFVVTADKAYFHNQPNDESARRGYLEIGDKANYTSVSNGYLYVSFTNSVGQTSSGWINRKDVQIVSGN